jgi:hypothetical protein
MNAVTAATTSRERFSIKVPNANPAHTISTGLGALGLLGWRKKRKAAASLATSLKHLIGFRRDRREAVFLCVPSMIDSLEV